MPLGCHLGPVLPGQVLLRLLGSVSRGMAEYVLVELLAVLAALIIEATKEQVSAPVGLPACGLHPPCSPRKKNEP